jgi:hypothetical protein
VLVQQNGHAGRDLVSEACAWTYVESAVLAAVNETMVHEEAPTESVDAVCSEPEVTSKKQVKQKKATRQMQKKVTIGRGKSTRVVKKKLQHLLRCYKLGHCLEAKLNAIFGNPGTQATTCTCEVASCSLPCSECQPFWNSPSPSPMLQDYHPPLSDPLPQKNSAKSTCIIGPALPPPLTREHREHATIKLQQFASH